MIFEVYNYLKYKYFAGYIIALNGGLQCLISKQLSMDPQNLRPEINRKNASILRLFTVECSLYSTKSDMKVAL